MGLGAVVALPALRKGLHSAAEMTSRGISETSDAISGMTGNVKSGWGAMVQDARTPCTNTRAGHVGAMTGAAIGGVVGASAGGPLGAGLGAVVGGGLGGAMGCHRTPEVPPPAESLTPSNDFGA
ncbi:MAG TPA: glycine zipper domain-containing protein [Spirochaetia bacterium]|nr:glycine zipper domain-containing protein [Spirochaetia bacterium]